MSDRLVLLGSLFLALVVALLFTGAAAAGAVHAGDADPYKKDREVDDEGDEDEAVGDDAR